MGLFYPVLTSIDESSINGESIPKEKSKGDEVLRSTINGTGTFYKSLRKTRILYSLKFTIS